MEAEDAAIAAGKLNAPLNLSKKQRRDQLAPQLRTRRLAYLRGSHVSCWSLGGESEAMWRLYCGSDGGVAIVTSYSRLRKSLAPDPATRLGLVRYVDYAEGELPDLNFMQPLMHKRSAFEHEHEVRIVRFLETEVRELMVPNPKLPVVVRFLDWDVERVAEKLVVSPYVDQWYFDAVYESVRKVASRLVSKLSWSKLRADPIY